MSWNNCVINKNFTLCHRKEIMLSCYTIYRTTCDPRLKSGRLLSRLAISWSFSICYQIIRNISNCCGFSWPSASLSFIHRDLSASNCVCCFTSALRISPLYVPFFISRTVMDLPNCTLLVFSVIGVTTVRGVLIPPFRFMKNTWDHWKLQLQLSLSHWFGLPTVPLSNRIKVE